MKQFFTKKELKTIIKELFVEGYGYWGRFDKYGCSSLAEEQDDYIKKIIQNELFNYREPAHGKAILNMIDKIAKAIAEQTILKIWYKRNGWKPCDTRNKSGCNFIF